MTAVQSTSHPTKRRQNARDTTTSENKKHASDILTLSILKTNGVRAFCNLPIVGVAAGDKTDEVLGMFKEHLAAKEVVPVCRFGKEGDYILLLADSNYYLWMMDDNYCKLGSRESALSILQNPSRHESLVFAIP